MKTGFLSLGANVGDALETLHAAVFAIHDIDGVAVDDVSGVYQTAPWPPPDDPRHVPQDPYLNLVVRVVTNLSPHALLDETQLVEAAFGRDRASEQRWGPRPLDIDLLVLGDEQVETDRLTLPHPRMAERAFVLVPLMEVWPGGQLPDGRRLSALLAALMPVEGIDLVVRLEDVPDRRIQRPAGPPGAAATFRRPGLAVDVGRDPDAAGPSPGSRDDR